DTLLPVFLSAAEKFQRQCREKPLFLLPRASTVNEQTLLDAGVALYRQEIDIHIVDEQRYDLMAACDAIIAASGTVTLEILLLETPMVVAYKVSPMSYRLGRVLVNIDYFCLVNLIAGKEIVRELLQDDANPGAIAAELHRLVFDESRQLEQLEGYREVRARLGKSGASAKAAALALSCLNSDG
ncbi:MAG: lipid-A-disaccharide synthase, partial [Desulfofustis sp.]